MYLFLCCTQFVTLKAWKMSNNKTWITPHAARPCRDFRASPGKQAQCYLQVLSPSQYLPFCWGQGSRAKKILFCSSPFLAPQPNSSMETWQGTLVLGPLEQLHGARSQRLPSCCWKGLQVTLSPTEPLWFHKALTHMVKTGVISRRLLSIHEPFH